MSTTKAKNLTSDIIRIANSGILPNGDHANESVRLMACDWTQFLKKCFLISCKNLSALDKASSRS